MLCCIHLIDYVKKYHKPCSGAVDKEYGKKNTSEVDRLIQGYFSVLTRDLFNTLTNLVTGNRSLQPADLKDIRSVLVDLFRLKFIF